MKELKESGVIVTYHKSKTTKKQKKLEKEIAKFLDNKRKAEKESEKKVKLGKKGKKKKKGWLVMVGGMGGATWYAVIRMGTY